MIVSCVRYRSPLAFKRKQKNKRTTQKKKKEKKEKYPKKKLISCSYEHLPVPTIYNMEV
jgi:hypothetical protein